MVISFPFFFCMTEDILPIYLHVIVSIILGVLYFDTDFWCSCNAIECTNQ